MKKIRPIMVVGLLCLKFGATAQEPVTEIKPLRVGDKLPETFWQQEHTVYANGKTTKQTLIEYKGKLLILDFWSTWCGPCVRSVPKLNGLKQRFGTAMNIILLSNDKAPRIDLFFSTNSYGMNNNLPIYRPNELLKSYFPHWSIPHLIWIGAHNEVIAITGSEELQPANISLAIAGMPLDVKVKDLIPPPSLNPKP